jgi:hypothetical protein
MTVIAMSTESRGIGVAACSHCNRGDVVGRIDHTPFLCSSVTAGIQGTSALDTNADTSF